MATFAARPVALPMSTRARVGVEHSLHPMAPGLEQRAHEAQQIGQRHRGWLVLWAVWHRTFTAFCCFASTPLVVEAATAEQAVGGEVTAGVAELGTAMRPGGQGAAGEDVGGDPNRELAERWPDDSDVAELDDRLR
jgi:hypothetical protein